MTDLSEFASFAKRLADAARAETLRRFEEGCETANKNETGEYDPVTQADRAAEAAMRALIEERYPGHAISGEEYGDRPGAGRYGWSLDPIDGTRSFICGLPSWTVLIALLEEGRPILGIIDAPALGERFLGYGSHGRLIGPRGERPLATSACGTVREARLSTTEPYLFKGAEIEGFERVRRQARVTRYGLDAYAYARLAAGGIDLVVESGLKPHDYNALVPVVRAAGGAIGNWRGEDDFREGKLVAAASKPLFEETIGLLAG